MTYPDPTILAVYIVLRTFYVELQFENTNSYEKRLLRLLLQVFLENLPVFEILLREPSFNIFFHRFGLRQSLGD